MCRFSFAPTDWPDDTSLVTPCKGFGTENLETFRKYLLNAHTEEDLALEVSTSFRGGNGRRLPEGAGCGRSSRRRTGRKGTDEHPVEEAPVRSRKQEVPAVQEGERSAEGHQEGAWQGASVESDDAPRDDDTQNYHEGNDPDLTRRRILGEDRVAELVLSRPRHESDDKGRTRQTERAAQGQQYSDGRRGNHFEVPYHEVSLPLPPASPTYRGRPASS